MVYIFVIIFVDIFLVCRKSGYRLEYLVFLMSDVKKNYVFFVEYVVF